MEKKIVLEVQHFHGCPNGPKMIQNVKEAIKPFSGEVVYNEVIIDSTELAGKYKFRGSPTLLINGEDFAGEPEPEYPSLSCRFYTVGIPRADEIEKRIINLIYKQPPWDLT